MSTLINRTFERDGEIDKEFIGKEGELNDEQKNANDIVQKHEGH